MICSGVYDGRNYCVDLETIRPIKLEELKKDECVIYGISGQHGNTNLYLGGTVNGKRRFCSDHLRELKQNIHPNYHLQNSVNKYGIKSFSFFIFEKCDKENLTEREQNWLDYYNDNFPKILFNIAKLADRANNPKEYIITYPSGEERLIKNLSAFCKNNGLLPQNMLKVAKGILSNTHDFKCRYPNETKQRYVKNPYCGGMTTSIKRAKKYLVTFPDGKTEIIKNLRQFCLKHNLDDAYMRHICAGRKKACKGFKCQKI